MTIEIKNKEDTLAELGNKKFILNAETGETTEVELDADDMAFFTKKAENRQAEHDAFYVDKLAKKETDAKAGNDKLVALGLTQDQVTAMTGYTPPVAE